MTSERAGGCVRAAGGRSNEHSTLKQKPSYESLGDFIEAYSPDDRRVRMESERFRRFSYQELVARDKASLDIFWLRPNTWKTLTISRQRGHRGGDHRGFPCGLTEFAEMAVSLEGETS